MSNTDPNVAHTPQPLPGEAPAPAGPGQTLPASGDVTQSSPAPPTAPASSAGTSTPLDVLGATAQVASIQRAQAATPEPPPAPEPDFPHWNEGQLLRYRWNDPHGDKEAYGLVLEVHHDDGVEDRVEVLWISTDRSGPIPASQFEDPADDK